VRVRMIMCVAVIGMCMGMVVSHAAHLVAACLKRK